MNRSTQPEPASPARSWRGAFPASLRSLRRLAAPLTARAGLAALACIALVSFAAPAHAQTTETEVAADWALKPSGLSGGDKFRLLFLTSTTRQAQSAAIADYNTFVQNRAAAGHTDIQSYSSGFRAVASTNTVDARDNTSTLGTGVPIYWLGGAKLADNYADFYDGSWDDEVNLKDESGNAVTTTYVWTGSSENGTKHIGLGHGSATATAGRPNAAGSLNGPIGSNTLAATDRQYPLYALSSVFVVGDSTDATLSALTVNDGTNEHTIDLATTPYTVNVDIAVMTVTLTATPNHTGASVSAVTLGGTAIADPDFTDGIAVPSLAEGDNVIDVTLTAEDGSTTKTYTVTVTRAAATTNNAPAFADSALTRSVAENTAAGENIGDALPEAADEDSTDMLTYALEGTDAASFTLDGRQLKTKSGVSYDYETKDSYSVTLKVDDGSDGTDTLAVTVNVTDEDEQPDTPGAPTVTATSGSETSLDVSWTEPGLNGGPAITGYEVRYRKGTTGDFTAKTHSGTGTTTVITGLEADTSYQVQVKALNGETPSEWSSSGTGSTITAPRPIRAGAAEGGTFASVVFSELLTGLEPTVPAAVARAFTVTVDGVDVVEFDRVTAGTTGMGMNTSLRMYLPTGILIYRGQTVTVSYDKTVAGADALADVDGNQVVSFADFPGGNQSTVSRPAQCLLLRAVRREGTLVGNAHGREGNQTWEHVLRV